MPIASRSRVLAILAASVLLLTSAPAPARTFRLGEIEGILDITLAYGILARVEGRDGDLIGIGNGGSAPSVNGDDGNLNYDVGIVSNAVQATGDLTLRWRNFGAFVRGFGFYDFETELSDRDRTDLSNDARDIVGRGGVRTRLSSTGWR